MDQPTHHVVPSQRFHRSLVQVYLHIAPLPPDCLPAQVIRHEDMTLVWADPGALRAELAFWVPEHLSNIERISFRLAFGQDPDMTRPPHDDTLAGVVGTVVIPALLRLPAEAERGSIGTA